MADRSTYDVVPGRNDPIRIVPLFLPDETVQPTIDGAAVAVPAAKMTYRGGPLLTAVEVVTVFWGGAWQSKQAPLVAQINAFFDFILTSALLDQMKEYSVSGKSIGHGRRTGTVTIATPAPPASVTDGAIARPQLALLPVPAARRDRRLRREQVVSGVLRLSRCDQ